MYRLFLAFKLFNGGNTPAALYGNLAQATNVAKTAFVLAAVLAGDALLVRIFSLILYLTSMSSPLDLPVIHCVESHVSRGCSSYVHPLRAHR